MFGKNVITAEAYRGKALVTECLNYPKELAIEYNFYKLMLLTDSKKKSMLIL